MAHRGTERPITSRRRRADREIRHAARQQLAGEEPPGRERARREHVDSPENGSSVKKVGVHGPRLRRERSKTIAPDLLITFDDA